MQVIIFIAENLFLPILAGVVAHLICKWIDKQINN